MQKKYGKEQQVVITMPLLEGTDGVEKMSKSLDNAIGITDEPRDIFGKTMSIPDAIIYRYFQLCTKLSREELLQIKSDLEGGEINPRDIKRRLGRELVKIYYDEATADNAIEEFDKLFIKKEIPDDIPELKMNEDEMKLTELLSITKLTESNSNSRRMIEQGAVSINGEKISDVNFIAKIENEMIIKVGKRKFLKILK